MLTLLSRHYCSKRKSKFGMVRCDCGIVKEVRMSSFVGSKSCGCMTSEILRNKAILENRSACEKCGRFNSGIKDHECLESLSQRFFKRVNKTDGCWIWSGVKFSNGYGRFCLSGKQRHYLAHRYSYEIHNGPIPEGLCVLHRCDVRNCVNPKHLWIGTQKDNAQDMVVKGRAYVGSRKLFKEDVIKIRTLAEHNTQQALANLFNVSASNIGMILRNITWKQ